MKAVILAAGVGSRLVPLTNNCPKSLIKIGDRTILERMILNINSVDIKDILIVTGYLENQIKDFVKSKFPNLNITFIKNKKYSITNTGYSLMLSKNFVQDSDFIKFDADVVFEKEILEKLVNYPQANCLCIDRNINLASEEVKVISNNGCILKVGKKLDPKLATGESIGIEKISYQAGKVLFEELENLMKKESNFQRYYDDSYTTLVEKGIPFSTVDITGLNWVEIDNFKDLESANKLFNYCTIYLVRHGETDWNQKNLVQGQTDTPLNKNGIKQAKALRKQLNHIKFDAFFSSDLIRAKHTAELVNPNQKLAIQTTKALRERRFGKFEGKSFKELNKFREQLEKINDKVIHDQIYKLEDMETDEEVIVRLLTFLREISMAGPGKTIFIACHGGIMRTALNHISGDIYKPGEITNTAYLEIKSEGVDFFIESMYGVVKK